MLASGGRGGRGGSGGSGGYGCPSGSGGSRGMDGYDGNKGTLYLVHEQHHPYLRDTSNKYFSLAELVAGQNLIKQMWSQQQGALDLLATGSFINNTFYNLEGYQHGSAHIQIKDEKMVDKKLLNDSFKVKLLDNVAKIEIPSTHVAIFKHSDDSNQAVMILERLYRASEFNGLEYEGIIGSQGDRQILFKTPAALIPQPELSLNLKVEIKGRFFKYHEVFAGPVDQTFIRSIESGYMVDLERLPLSQKIKSGDKIRLSMETQLSELTLVSRKKQETWVIKVQ